MNKPRLAISVGDLNGVGIEIIFKAHKEISQYCEPIYCVNRGMLEQAANLLFEKIPDDFRINEVAGEFDIHIGEVDAQSGQYSFDSFQHAVALADEGKVDGIVTLPIHKEAWMLAGIEYKGHTDFLRDHFKQEAIMMLGCEKMYVALFTEHIPLRTVPSFIHKDDIKRFLLDFHKNTLAKKAAVLGLNPHAGDNGVLGNEEKEIKAAIKEANATLKEKVFFGPVVPDIAFTPHFRKGFNYFVAMYHDQGLAPLKALYFDESINVSLNLPIIRTSVDHGTAFDIAYKGKTNILSYVNAVNSAISFIK